jgi:penicillin amidase
VDNYFLVFIRKCGIGDGNIGMSAGGGIPIREGDGILIRDGTTDRYDWKGYVPFEQMPFSLNPENGTVSSANNRTVSDDYPYFISHSFDLPYRINRIREMIGQKQVVGVEDFIMMLADQHSDYARLVTPYLLKLNDRQDEMTPLELQALDALEEWNHEINPALPAPTIFEFFRRCFLKNLLADELGELFDKMWDISGEYYIYRILTTGPDYWVDNINTPETETLNDIVILSFRDAVSSLEKDYGRDPSQWKWGRSQLIRIFTKFTCIDRKLQTVSASFPNCRNRQRGSQILGNHEISQSPSLRGDDSHELSCQFPSPQR